MPLLENILSKFPPERAKQFLRLDQSLDLVYLRCRNLPDVNRRGLFKELAANNVQTKLHGWHYISGPASWFLNVLEGLYGRPILL